MPPKPDRDAILNDLVRDTYSGVCDTAILALIGLKAFRHYGE